MRRIALPVLALLLFCLPAAAQWQGEFVDGPDGRRVVNPETPAAGESTLGARELWRVGDDEEDVLIGVVSELLHDADGNVYLLDGQLSEIQVLDPDGQWLNTIGREGEGPGEFRNASDMFWIPGGQIGVLQTWPGKIVTLRPDGTPGDAMALPFDKGGSMQIGSLGHGIDGGIVMAGAGWTREDGGMFQLSYLKAVDAAGNDLAVFHEDKREQSFGNWEFREERWVDFQRRWTAAPDGRVAAALSFDDYRIHVWNRDGSLAHVIERPGAAPVERTGEEKQAFQAAFDAMTRWNPGSTFRIRDTHQAVGRLFYRQDGSLWVQSAAAQWRSPEGRFTSFDVYDRDGRFVRRVHLDLDGDAAQDGVFFDGDRMYVVTDLMSAFMASMGVGGDAGMEPEPVNVIAYRVDPVSMELTRTP